ncbi:MAG: monofunctional biosynthetic peptidoglycan transglycosylase [Chitinophagaceae bacterium]|nr:monofunctional biosynthetic peptidoglycan transglycosylase [Chitinophagaceae bacterium]
MPKTLKKHFSFKRFFSRLILVMFLSSLGYVILCRWVMPPITITQLISVIKGEGLKKNHVRLKDISAYAKLAAIASEDQLFPDHSGFDWKSLEKSLSVNPSKKNKIRGAGASTISQQVAKNVFLWQGNGVLKYLRKIPEFYFTTLIELIWGKRRILEVYLNVIETGRGVYGIDAAARQYFHKPAKNLSANESAMIIASLPNPKKYTVVPVSRWVSWKSQWILRQMNNVSSDVDIRKLCR